MPTDVFQTMDQGSGEDMDATYAKRALKERVRWSQRQPEEVPQQQGGPGDILGALKKVPGQVVDAGKAVVRGTSNAVTDLLSFPLVAGAHIAAAGVGSDAAQQMGSVLLPQVEVPKEGEHTTDIAGFDFGPITKGNPELSKGLQRIIDEGYASVKEKLFGKPTPGSQFVEKIESLPFYPLTKAAELATEYISSKTGDPLAGNLAGLVAMMVTGKALHAAGGIKAEDLKAAGDHFFEKMSEERGSFDMGKPKEPTTKREAPAAPVTALKLTDGTIVVDPQGGHPLHIELADKLGIDPAKIADGGFWSDGEYQPGSANAKTFGDQARAKERVAQKRAERATEKPPVEPPPSVSPTEAPGPPSQVGAALPTEDPFPVGEIGPPPPGTFKIPTPEEQAALQAGWDAFLEKTTGEPAPPTEPPAGGGGGSTPPEGRYPGPWGINLSHIDTADSVKSLMKDVIDKSMKDILAERGGESVPRETQVGEAHRLIQSGEFTASDLMSRVPGENWKTPAHGIAARIVYTRIAEDTFKLIGDSEKGIISEADGQGAMKLFAAATAKLAGGTAEAGRTLEAYRADVSGIAGSNYSKAALDAITAMQDGAGGDWPTAARRFLSLGDPKQREKYMLDLMRPGAGKMAQELWYGALLSNPATSFKKASSDVIMMFNAIQERAQGAAYRSVNNAVRRALGGQEIRGVEAGEPYAYIHGMIESYQDMLQGAARTAKTGQTSFGHGYELWREPAVTVSNLKALGNRIAERLGKQDRFAENSDKIFDPDTVGMIGKAFDHAFWLFPQGPGRALMTITEAAKIANYRGEIAAQAWRGALRGDGEGKTAGERYQYLKDNPTDMMINDAKRWSLYQTFTDDGGRFTQAAMQFRESHPLVRIVLPFIQIPSRIAHAAFQRMPILNMLSTELRQDLFGTDPVRKDLAMAKVGTSVMAAATVASLVAAGRISGGGPRDRQMKTMLESTGWLPYSIRFGDEWVSYEQSPEPYGMIFGAIADYGELKGSMNPDEETNIESIPMAAVLGFTRAFTSKTYMMGFANAIDAIRDPERSGIKAAKQAFGSIIPAGISSANRNWFDPYKRETQSLLDSVKSRVPGYSEYLPSMKDPWGEPSINHGWAGGILLPYKISEQKHDPATEELISLGISVPRIPKTFDGPAAPLPESVSRFFKQPEQLARSGVPWTPKEYDDLVRLYGNILKIDWEGDRQVDMQNGVGMHDFLNQIVTDKAALPNPVPLPDGGEADRYSQLPPAKEGTPGSEMRSDLLRSIMKAYKTETISWYLDYQHEKMSREGELSKGKKSMLMLKVERQGGKGVRHGMNPSDANEAVQNALEGLQIGQ